jgi:hypothetical protein
VKALAARGSRADLRAQPPNDRRAREWRITLTLPY